MFTEYNIELIDFDAVYERLSKVKQCVFCDPEKKLILHETQNFYLLADPFPIYLGHLLIVSKLHYGDLGELPDSHLNEFLKLKRAVQKFFVKKFNTKGVCYEHGRSGHCLPLKDSECHHFHFHMIPVCTDITQVLKENFYVMSSIEYAEVKKLHLEYGSYFLFESIDRLLSFVVADDPTIPPHFLRTTLSDSLGVSNRSKWTDYQSLDIFQKSLKALLE